MKSLYQPNEVPLPARVALAVIAVGMLAYGGYGVYVNDLPLRLGRRWRRVHEHFQDTPAVILFAAIICGACILLSVLVDHYDRRNNEEKYQAFAEILTEVGLMLFFAACVLHFGYKLVGVR